MNYREKYWKIQENREDILLMKLFSEEQGSEEGESAGFLLEVLERMQPDHLDDKFLEGFVIAWESFAENIKTKWKRTIETYTETTEYGEWNMKDDLVLIKFENGHAVYISKTIEEFAKRIIEKQERVNPEIGKVIEEKLWELF